MSQHKTRKKQHANPIKGSTEKPIIGQGRAGLKRKRLDAINQTIIPPSELSQKIPGETKIETKKKKKTNHIHSMDPMQSANIVDEGMTHTRSLIPDVPFHPGPTYRPLPKPFDLMYQELKKVHRVYPVQKILDNILI